MTELSFLSACAMAEQVRAKQISPVELVDAHLARIDRLNPLLNAFVELDYERARKDARGAEAAVARGEVKGPLHGIPISIKSSIEVAGLKNEAGTRLRAGIVAGHDAPLVSRLREAGAIVLGVTNTPELLMAWETDNLLIWADEQSLGFGAHCGRIEWRRGGGHRVRMFGGRRGQRRWRLDSSAGALQRNLWSEADSWADPGNRALSEFGRTVRFIGGSGADGANRGGCAGPF